MSSFIRAIEYWVPSHDGHILEYGDGIYGAHRQFEAVSRALCFGRGEGLPGQAWESGHPVMLKAFDATNFRRTVAAQSAGITGGIAIPIHDGPTLSAVLVIFCGDAPGTAGAIELWHARPALSPDMTLQDGHYGHTGDTFEFISRSTTFRRGTGLPGLAWQSGRPVFMDDLGRGSGFLRSDSAQRVGINRGLAVPCSSRDGRVHVLALLSALATPIARRMEIWRVDAAQQQLSLEGGFCESEGTLAPGSLAPLKATGPSPISQVLAARRPAIRRLPPGAVAAAPLDASIAAMPVFDGPVMTAVVAFYL